jgi:NAD+ diphosphatase
MQEIVPFSGNPLDRASNQRRDAAWLVEQVDAPDSRFVAFWRLNSLPRVVEQPEICWLDAGVLADVEDGAAPLLLGLRDGIAHFAVDLSALANPLATVGIEGANDQVEDILHEFGDTRSMSPYLRMA